MPRVCTGCSHPDRKGLEAAIVAGRPKAEIARAWGLKPDAVHGHAKHIAPKVAKAAEKEGRTLAGMLTKQHRRYEAVIRRNAKVEDEVVIRALKGVSDLLALEFGTKSKTEITMQQAAWNTLDVAEKRARLDAAKVRIAELEAELGDGIGAAVSH